MNGGEAQGKRALTRRMGLTVRFASVMAAVLVLFGTYSWLLAADAAKDLASAYSEKLAREEARFLLHEGAERMELDGLGGARAMAAMSLRHKNGLSGAVFDPAGRLISSWGPDSAEAANRGLRFAIQSKDQVFGELRVLGPKVSMGSLLSSGFAEVSAMIAAVLALCVACVVALVRRVIAPLQRLTEHARSVNERSMSERIELRTGDELESLAEAFNDMMGRLDESMRRIQQLAYTDPATGLANQERLQRCLERSLVRCGEEQRAAALVVLSFEQLRRTMESLGRSAADALLRAVADRLAATALASDRVVRVVDSSSDPAVLARLGAAEFAVLLPTLDQEMELERFVQMVSAPFGRPFEHGEGRISLGLRIGAVVLPRDGYDAEAALRNARVALAAARDAQQPTRFFTPSLDRDAAERLTLEREMRIGIERNQFRAFFQPKVCLRRGSICGAEALARWVRPDGVVIGPGRFIPLAEELGMIGPIAEAIMREACWKAAAWRREGMPIHVAVNVSAIQLNDERFPALVRRMLDEAGLSGNALELEITESVAMNDPERAIRLVEPLRAQGVRFAIDDFGTGHSSLGALTRLPFDVLKIDQSFVRSLSTDAQAVSIIETILALAASLNFESVAEGVETEAEAEFLRRRGCPIAQGYHFGRPMPPLEFLATLRAQAQAKLVTATG